MKQIYRLILWLTCLFLLYKKSLNGIDFGFALILGEIALNLDLIEVLKFGSNYIKLNQLKKEIYASINTVKELAMEMSKVTSYALSRIGKFAPTDLNERLVKERIVLFNLLKKLNISNEQIDEILFDLDNSILKKKESKV